MHEAKKPAGRRERVSAKAHAAESLKPAPTASGIEHDRELLGRIVAHAPVAIAVMKAPDLEYAMVNPAYEAIMGPQTRFTGRSFRDLFPEAAARGAEAGPLEVIRSGRASHVESFETGIPGREGPTWWEGECLPLPGESGKTDAVLVVLWEVTKRKRAEAALRERDERYALVVAGAEAAIWDWDVLNQRVLFSPRWKELRGLSEEEVGDHEDEWARRIHPEDAPRVMSAVRDHFEGRRAVFSEEYRVRHKDGHWVWIHDRGIARRDASGQVVRMAGSETDITARKRVEEELRRSEERFRGIFEGAAVAIWEEDFSAVKAALDGLKGEGVTDFRRYFAEHPEFVRHAIGLVRVVDVNPAVVRMYGARDREALMASLGELILPESEAVFREELVALAEGRSFFQSDAAQRTLDGRRLDVLVSIAFPADGDFRRVLVTLADITERKQAERALRESEARKTAMFETALDCVISIDHEGKVVEWNPAAERTFGYRGNEALGRELTGLIIPPSLRERHREGLARYLVTGEGPVLGRRIEMSALRADGTELPVELSVTRIPAEGPPLFTAYLRDITERVRAEEALRDADRRKDEFLATLSHELRNPLAPLRNSLELLRRAGAGDAVVKPVHDIMERQVNHLVRLVDDLMEMSRITRGSFELRREPLELETVLRNALETAKPLIDAAGHDLRVRLPAEPMRLEGDAVRLAQVFANLLNNAAKYTPEGGRIRLEARREGDEAVVVVSDTGEGIDPDQLPRLFEMFSQGNRTSRRTQGGLGIGLALARRLAEMHGGTVEAESEGPGKGSRFTARLPLGGSDRALPAGAQEPGRLAPHRVLVVDDNRDAAASLGMLLNFLGADVHVAHDGVSAIEAFDACRPAIVLLDIGMPGMDGYEVARALRSRAGGAQVTLVALTGWGQEEDRRRARDAGFDHHLIKPAGIDALQALLAAGSTR